MAIEHIHTYLVHPCKQTEVVSRIGGTTVPLRGKLFNLLSDVYVKSDDECDIDISFNHREDGTQSNPCRDLLLRYLRNPSLPNGKLIAERMEKVTTHRSGLGLLFIIIGLEDRKRKIVISRFPADSAILAEENRRTLSVAFLERVFMKSATAYKAALYQDESIQSGFWMGRAIDKQINSRAVHLSKYWIADFLDSDFRTTSATGTKRLAVALRDAAKKTDDLRVKSEIAAAVTLARNLEGQMSSIREFAEHFRLSDEAHQAILNEVRTPSLAEERFRFSWDEFSNQVAYRTVKLDTGGILTAPSEEFDQVFEREAVEGADQRERFSTEGRVISEKLEKMR